MIGDPFAPVYEAETGGPTIVFGITEAKSLDADPAKIYGAGWDVPGTATTPPSAARAAYLRQFPSAMTIDEAEYAGKQALTGGKPTGPPVVATPVLLVGGLGVAAVAALTFLGRRRNPRRRLSPLLALGGAAAALWWAGRRTVAQAQAAVAQRSLEGVFGG